MGSTTPFVAGSSNKGSTKSQIKSMTGTALTGLNLLVQVEELFGSPQLQGSVLFGDLRLLPPTGFRDAQFSVGADRAQ